MVRLKSFIPLDLNLQGWPRLTSNSKIWERSRHRIFFRWTSSLEKSGAKKLLPHQPLMLYMSLMEWNPV